ncbi:MAG: hypothetical protein AB8B64_14565 [Granulosicoccus sp.]
MLTWPVGVACDLQHASSVQQPVEQGLRGDHLEPEQMVTFAGIRSPEAKGLSASTVARVKLQ